MLISIFFLINCQIPEYEGFGNIIYYFGVNIYDFKLILKYYLLILKLYILIICYFVEFNKKIGYNLFKETYFARRGDKQ